MDTNAALLEAAQHLRKAASLLESAATGNAPKAKAPRVPGLKKMIKNVLADGGVRSSEEMANLLYDPSMGLDRGTFLRRVVVTLSSMHKADGTITRVEASNHSGKKSGWMLRGEGENDTKVVT